MPGQPVCARAHFQFPPAIHPRELPAATSVTANIVQQLLENCHVFAGLTLRHAALESNKKTFHSCAEAVERKSCLWKTEEKSEEILGSKLPLRNFNHLHDGL
jgi:hypothetical protein